MPKNTENGAGRPWLHPARSFTRMDQKSTGSPVARSRSKTVQNANMTEYGHTNSLPLPPSTEDAHDATTPDVFDRSDPLNMSSGDEAQAAEEISFLSRSLQSEPVELPIALASLTDRFINSLNSRVISSPSTIEKISGLFQDLYRRAESHIATHISALASRINRDSSPPSSEAGQLSSGNRTDRVVSNRQMLTAKEVAERRNARKALIQKRIALEEAVERRACEGLYDKIWRHKGTLDEIRDEKLRSKTAALSVIGINLKDLGVDVDFATVDETKQRQANEFLSAARECIMRMNDENYPLGKLQHLAGAHKAIVDALTNLLPSSSSADEILPTLIYSLIICAPESLNVISNLMFIQRFRSSNKIDGEAAYCLTNLEAAVSFLENVDLSSLRSDETQDGTAKGVDVGTTPATENPDALLMSRETPSPSLTSVSATSEFLKPNSPDTLTSTLPRSPSQGSAQQRRLTSLIQPSVRVLGAANDAVRNTADQSLKNIGATLDSSFNFLFGRLKEVQVNQGSGNGPATPILPKTLAEARRLIALPSTDTKDFAQDDRPAADQPFPKSSPASKPEDQFLRFVSGGQTPRDRSVDSTRSPGSSAKSTVSASAKGGDGGHGHGAPLSGLPGPGPSSSSSPSTLPAPLESVKNFGNTFNPLNHIPDMLRSLGRNTSETPIPAGPGPIMAPTNSAVSERTSKFDDSPPRIAPPIQRFITAQDASELRIGDVALLLDDYKRLAAALGKS